ncbi:RNA 2'-phosphotransferase [Acinetobacter sp. LF10]|uniref:RNA 2'-phosphotransferase n=1 Tax=Acinetobacter sp. LF10 TaxID=3403576 RepID=UPI003B21DF4F
MKTHTQTSKFLSLILRHKPEQIGLQLDQEGWAKIDELIEAAQQHNTFLDDELIQTIVAQCDKKRFQISDDGLNIRAVQGHSTLTVQREMIALKPPQYLYHGTASRFIDSIQTQGLIAGQRHYVHLSEHKETALNVGQRYGKPILFLIDTVQMYKDGFTFHQAENGVWLITHVPTQYLSLIDQTKTGSLV